MGRKWGIWPSRGEKAQVGPWYHICGTDGVAHRNGPVIFGQKTQGANFKKSLGGFSLGFLWKNPQVSFTILSKLTLSHLSRVLGSNDPNTIPDPTWIRCSCSCMLHYVSARTPFLFGLSYVYVPFGLRDFPVTCSRDFLDICFMFPFHYSLCFPRAHYVSLFHFLGLRSFPSTLVYCTSLIVDRKSVV